MLTVLINIKLINFVEVVLSWLRPLLLLCLSVQYLFVINLVIDLLLLFPLLQSWLTSAIQSFWQFFLNFLDALYTPLLFHLSGELLFVTLLHLPLSLFDLHFDVSILLHLWVSGYVPIFYFIPVVRYKLSIVSVLILHQHLIILNQPMITFL